MSESEESLPSDVEEVAKDVVANLLPRKSKATYETAYTNFQKWCEDKKIKIEKKVSEKVLLAYFSNKSKVFKPSTMWSHYSMLRTTISINNNVDISKFTNLIAFLKRNADGYRPRKSKTFSKEDFSRFLIEADDHIYLGLKVIFIVGMAGGCRKNELLCMRTEDVSDCDSFIKISVPNTKTKIARIFTITEGDVAEINLIAVVRKYIQMRPRHVQNNRFFLGYRNGKCIIQPVGINTFSDIPKRIATFLGLQSPELYTSHAFRRSSATLLSDSGADLQTLKRHGGWKSNVVAESYVDESVENKRKIAMKILGKKTSTNIAVLNESTSASIRSNSYVTQIFNNDGNEASSLVLSENSEEQKAAVFRGNTFEHCTFNIYNK